MTRHRGLGPRVAVSAFAVTLAVGLTAPPAFAANGDRPWLDTSRSPEERAELLLDAMTLDQKIQQLGIVAADESDVLEGCEQKATGRVIVGIPDLGIPNFRMTNGGTGVKGGSCDHDPIATGLPSTPAMAATFDRDLNYTIGEILGEETYAYAHQVMLGPGVNLIRHPYAGRAFEYPSEDPFLAGMVGVEQIRGLQDQGIQGQIKHFAFNEQEEERWTAAVHMPSRAANELYLIPFEMVVKDADVASVMCAFPYINGTWACDNEQLIQRVLYDRWGFDGWVMSDRRATHSTVQSIKAGTGVELNTEPIWYTPERITAAIDAGDITEADIDALLFPRYVQMFRFGHFEDHFLEFGEVDLESNGEQARQVAEDGMVLLKNEGDLLPLTGEEDTVALIGVHEFAGQAKLPPRSGNDFGETVVTPYKVSPEEGLERVLDDLGSDTEITRADGTDLDEAVQVAEDADVVLFVIGDAATETRDKDSLDFPEFNDVDQEELIDAVIGVNPNTVVVLKTVGYMNMPWLDEVPAVLEAWYPGQEDGNAFANVVYGVVNPSGKLPITFGTSDREAAYATDRQYPGVREDTGLPGGPGFEGEPGVEQLQFYYDEDLEMGYRWYEANDVEPTFAFGHGLSYTTFEYSDLSLTPVVEPGRTALQASWTLTNTGDRAGAEAGQVYLTLPAEADEPGKRLVGFDKVHLEPGESTTVSVTVDSAAANHPMSYWEPASDDPTQWAEGEWVTPNGQYTVHVGGASDDTPLEETLTVTHSESPGGDEGQIPIEAEMPDIAGEPGSLTLTIHEFGDSVDLGPARRQVDRLRWDGDLPTVAVTDTRNDEQAGGSGWSVSGIAEDFTSDDDTFSAAYLGWLPWTTADDRPGVDAGPRVWGQMRGGPGLAEPQTLVSATNEGRRGSATAGAHLVLETPLDTPPGDYRSSIHLTLFPVD